MLADPADEPPAKPEVPAPDKAAELPLSQEQVLRKYQRFEEVLLRMSELTAASDPKRAALLRKAVGQSKDKLIGVQFDRLVDLLKRDQLATAVTNQKEVEGDLKQLLDLLLSEQRADRLKSERERIKEQIRRINELINKQQQLQGQTQGSGDPQKLAPSQGKLGEQTGKLAEDMNDAPDADSKSKKESKPSEDDSRRKPPDGQKDDNQKDDKEKGDEHAGNQKQGQDQDGQPKEGGDEKSSGKEKKPADESEQKPDGGKSKSPQESKPADGQKSPGQSQEGGQPQPPPPGQSPEGEQSQSDQPPPSDSEAARQRVREAQKAMDEARKKLEQAKREGAAEDQEQARRKLEEAKARLEEVLRQLREEEVERSLALLEARFRKMLQMQTEVYEGTVRVDRVKPEDRTQNEEIEAGRLSRHERAILEELSGAEMLLREDGTSVAFPEAVRELREDMEQVAARLAEAKVDQITQLTEQDILAALEEMIAAFQKAQKENEEKKQQQQQQAGEQQEPPLVDAIAELKMIRALQMRVNKRTANFAKLVDGDEGQADKAELLDALEKLSQREQRIYRTTRDIVLGKNE
ncbi:MAG: hypothetical protein B7Z73_09140 [Planctomycetia bacterium 21-64-5]|nr:MAG: hypothetical protein B7Z73_09140 [Planctomycetia bacterium 21-64-5]